MSHYELGQLWHTKDDSGIMRFLFLYDLFFWKINDYVQYTRVAQDRYSQHHLPQFPGEYFNICTIMRIHKGRAVIIFIEPRQAEPNYNQTMVNCISKKKIYLKSYMFTGIF